MAIREVIREFEYRDFYTASKNLFSYLSLPLNILTKDKIDIKELLGEHKEFDIIDSTYLIGEVNDEIFKGKKRDSSLKRERYESLLIFAIELNKPNPSKRELADISRVFNSNFEYTPITILFKYGNSLALSNTQRQEYKQQWRSGKRVGKVTILKDIDIKNPHRGHLDILAQMSIKDRDINSYEELYEYWQRVFDIELLQKSFYKRLFEIFQNLLSSLEYPEDNYQKRQDFIVRLIGRVLFLKFLEKKGVIPPARLNFKENYYHFVLEPLFFEILNKPIDKRDSLLLEDGDEKIPFLNGGLFEPYQEDFYGAQFLSRLNVSDEHLKGLLELFNRYYFTIDENTPLESEIGLDPELLGMVFENLIGYINPETQKSARKETGSFYTPREIVDFMVSDSILEYLKGATQIDESILKELIFNSDNSKIDFSDKLKILGALNSLKILDPACGSGAYPMGLLNKIVEILNLIDIEANEWLKLQSREFQAKHKDKNPNYIRKLSIIQNSIFGIDIQPVAVEISKLRFFLSLLVDEDKNRIEPLPNMEFKIVCANTLLPLEKINFPKDKQDNLFSKESLEAKYRQLLNELKELKRDYFYASFTQKEKIKKEFNLKLQEIISLIERLDLKEALNNKLHSYNPFEPSSSAKFFDNEYMFNLPTEGFDIVIGNPPYIREEKIKPLKSEIVKINKTKSAPIYQNGKHYLTYNGTADIYVYFFEKGYQLLKRGGVLSYITSNSYTRTKYGRALRDFILSNTAILNYIDFNGIKVFKSAEVDTSILTFKKVKTNIQTSLGAKVESKFIYCNIDESYKKEDSLAEFIFKKGFLYNQSDLSIDSFSFANPTELKIKEHIETIGVPLKEWDININSGIKTGFNKAFIIDGKTKDELIKKDPKSAKILKPLLKGRDIKKYSYNFEDKWLIATFPALKLNIDEYPAIKEYLKGFGKRLEQSGEKGSRKKTNNKWFETQDQIAYWKEFEKEKIIFSKASKNTVFYLDEDKFYFDVTAYMITGDNLNYLVSLLNSDFIKKIFYRLYSGGGIDGEITIFALEQLPIPQIPKEEQKPFETLVDFIIYLKRQDRYLEARLFEDIIDIMVFELYFKDELKKRNLDIIDSLKSDIDSLNSKDIDKSIQILYKKWNNQDSRVKRVLERFNKDAPDILKPILES